MNQSLHIIRKDVSRMRWPLLLWVLMLLARVGLWYLSANGPTDFARGILVNQLGGALASLETLLLAFLAARLIHGEAPVGWNAFWLTRPYSRNALIAAKLVFAGVVLLMLPLAADLITMAMFSAGGDAQSKAALTFTASYATWILPLLALAAMTPSLAAFAMAIMAIVVAFALLLVGTLGTVLLFGVEPSTFTPSPVTDPAPQVFAMMVTVVVALGLIAFQYRYRRWRMAVGLAVAGALLTAQAPAAWQKISGRAVETDPGAWSRDPSASPAVVDRHWYTDVDHSPSFGSGVPMHRVYGRIRLQGMPSDYVVESVSVDATLRLPGGTTLRSKQSETFTPPLVSTPDGVEWPGEGTALRAALGDVRLVQRMDEPNFEHWPALIKLSREDYARHQGKTGRLSATLFMHLNRTRRRGVLPLESGAALDEGLSRVEVLRAGDEAGGFGVAVRHWKVFPLLEPRSPTYFTFILQNRSRGEALTSPNRTPLPLPGSGSGGWSGNGVLLAALGSASLGPNRNAFAVDAEHIYYANRIVRPGETLTFAPEWFDGAELVILERSYAGTVTRSLVIDDFRIPTE